MTLRRIVAALVSTATALIGLQALAPQAQANPAGTALVINEVFGGGGNVGAPYNQDFVELYNPTSSAISVTGMSVQYRSGTGNSNPSGVIPLTGSVASHGYYLVGGATGVNGSPLPT